MVRIGVGEDKRVNPSYLLLPKEWGNHILPRVKTVCIKAPSIDEHLLPLGEFDEDGIAMSHIDKS